MDYWVVEAVFWECYIWKCTSHRKPAYQRQISAWSRIAKMCIEVDYVASPTTPLKRRIPEQIIWVQGYLGGWW